MVSADLVCWGAIGIVVDVIDTDPIEDLAVGWLWALILNFAYGFFAKHNNDVPNEPLQSTEQFEHAETLYQSPQVEFQKEDQRNSLSNDGGRLNLLKIILVVAIGIGILLGALYYYNNYLPYNQIKTTLVYNINNCASTSPIQVTIVNNSNRTLTNSICRYRITRIGYSNILNENLNANVTVDKILLPGEQISGCTTMPTLNTSIEPTELIIGHYGIFTFERNWLDDFWDFFT